MATGWKQSAWHGRSGALAALLLASGSALAQDFNGDGMGDLAIGSPGETIAGLPGAGIIHVIYGTPGGGLDAFAPLPAQEITQATFGIDIIEAGDGFGAALAWGDFNMDGFDDLAVGAPGEDSPLGVVDAGVVLVFYGTPAGLMPIFPPIFAQGFFGVPEVSEMGDMFGSSLAAGDFNLDGMDDLAVGVPFEDAGVMDQGMVHVLSGTAAGLMGVGAAFPIFVQPAIFDPAEPGDQFGRTLAAGDINGDGTADLAIGVPMEDLPGLIDAGMAHAVYGMPGPGLMPAAIVVAQVWTQDSAGIGNVAEAGDQFGAALAIGSFNGDPFGDLAIGVPFEDLGPAVDTGAVHVIYSGGPGTGLTAGAPVPNQFWHQNTAGVPEVNAIGDQFGAALAAGNFDAIMGADLAIGIPFEDVGAAGVDTGSVIVIYSGGAAVGLAVAPVVPQLWDQGVGVPESNGVGDMIGAALAVGDWNGDAATDLAMGVPGEDVGGGPVVDAGCVNTIYGLPGVGLTVAAVAPVAPELWHQDTAGIVGAVAMPGDAFGAAMSRR